MDKVVKILEQHVQWFALGFAVLFLGWTGYSYLFVAPLHVAVGTPPFDAKPGEVDEKIRDGSAKNLEVAMKDPEIQPPKVADVLAQFRDGIDLKTVVVTDWNPPLTSQHQPVGGVDSSGQVVPGVLVDKLPILPPAIPDKQVTRWTVIMVPGGAAPAPAPVVPGQPAAAPAAPVMHRQDVAYWSGTFQIDVAALAKQYNECFAKANLPLNAMNAEFVRVELLREEQNADGVGWSKPVIVSTLPIHDLMAYPADKKPALAADPLLKAWYEYKTWLEQNQDIIVHPAFYETASDAEPWISPGNTPVAAAPEPGGGVVAPQRPFDPSRDTPKTDAERAQAQAYKNAQIQAQRERAMRGRRPGMIGPGGGPGAYIPPPGYTGPRPTPNPNYPGNPSAPSPYAPPIVPPNFNNSPPPFINPNAGGPNGFNPGLAAANPDILVHDATIQEGHTYRYAVRYKLFNPMFNKAALAVPAVAAKFDMDSPDPADPAKLAKADPPIVPDKLWTAKVTVEPRAHIYVQNIQLFRNEVDFIVYTWKDGRWHQEAVNKRTPGDPVTVSASKEPTPWTVVDVRKDPHSNEAYVLLIDNNGVLTRRDVASDQADPEWQKLKSEAVGGAAASAGH